MRVPFNDAPTADPSGPGNDYQQVQANPSAFGAGIAQATEGFGKELEQHAIAFQGMQNEATAKDADIAYSQALDDLQFNPQGGFLTLKGKAAVDAYPQMHQQVMDLYQQHRAALPNPAAQKLFDSVAVRRAIYSQGDMSRYAQQQNQDWVKGASLGRIAQATNESGLYWNDDQRFARSIGTIHDEVEQLGQMNGEAPEQIAASQSHYASEAWTARIKGVSATDPLAAQKMLDGAGTQIDAAHKAALTDMLREPVIRQKGTNVGKQALFEAGTAASNAAPVSNIKDAILQQESNANPNAPTSIDGAVGQAQIIPATFAQYAKPGEVITNPADNKAVGARIIDDLSKKYDGDPARIAVGYFSGPGNVAPLGSPTPWINDYKDGNGKSVSSYVQDVAAKVNSPGITARADAFTRVLDLTKNEDPAVQKAALSYVNEQYTVANVASLADQKAKKDASDQSANGYVTRILKGDTSGVINQIASDPTLNWETKERLSGIAEQHLKGTVDGEAQTYGPGFWDAYKAITAAPNDPNRVTDPGEILRRAGPQPTKPPDFPLTGAPGMTKPGNLDPWDRPSLRNPDGSYSTTSSISIGTDGGETIIPTVVNGKRLSNDDAIKHFKDTGENFGTFSTVDAAEQYGQALHNAQATLYDPTGKRLTTPGDLTLQGVEKLTSLIRTNDKPDGVAENHIQAGALAYAKHKLSFEADYGNFKVRDPKGEDAFNVGFTPAFFKYYEEGRAAGKSPAELMDKKNLDPLIAAFKRTPAQEMADRLAGGDVEAGSEGSKASAVTPKSREEFDALPKGAVFINPADGKQYRKK